ncbi:hypothetical protein CK203_071086 [Vitis vinifera]|uniref:Reverse transcriptase domain-containing protein n=1 Tax=Vitis vinifera TaxID=29760 RepID=A0A438E995_VITVI|nr:hypothetical protein CK203_071086 [Vitis vinifera]
MRVKGRSEEGVQISHLLFADDTLVFCQASQDHLTYLSWLLMWFEAVLGLRINLEKSELIPIGRVENINDLALDFGCKVGSLPSTYLGLPLGALFKSVTMWDGVEERFRRREVWGRKRGMVLSGSERGAWCRALERNKDGLGFCEPLDFIPCRKREWRIFGTPWLRGVGGIGILVFQEPSMIGRWKRQKDSWSGFMGRECLEICIWNVWVQPKISFFAWEATWGKALTLDLIQKRGWVLANRCFMCLEKEETIDHLPLHCIKTRVLWDLLFNLFGLSWVLPSSVRETLLGWYGSFVGEKRKKVWRTAPLYIFWTVWKARNRLAFKDNVLSIQRLK